MIWVVAWEAPGTTETPMARYVTNGMVDDQQPIGFFLRLLFPCLFFQPKSTLKTRLPCTTTPPWKRLGVAFSLEHAQASR
jgi:hypothetical protein